MSQTDLGKLSDAELMDRVKQNKPSPLTDAFFIGFLVGIIIYGAAANAWGFVVLIPLFLVYLILKKPKQYEALRKELKKRNLE